MRTTCREFFAYDHGLPICFHLGPHPAGLSSERPLPRYSANSGSPPHLLVFPLSYRVQEHPSTRATTRGLVLNPFAPFVVAYQALFLYNTPPTWAAFTAMLCVGVSALLGGLLVFSHFRWSFVEEV
jgi:hypothetical protein